MVIDGYFIGGYWCLLMVIILMAIDGYSIGGYWCLLMVIILMTIDGYSIGGYNINGCCGYFINVY